jgi:hypothetical protein
LSRRFTAPSVLVGAAVIACLGIGGNAPASERAGESSATAAAGGPAGKGRVLGAKRFLRRHARRACSTRYARRRARRLVRGRAAGHGARRQARRVLRMRRCRGGRARGPRVRWRAPRRGSTVSGALSGPSCRAKVSGGRRVERVVFFVDGKRLNTEREAPYTCEFDSKNFANGPHTLKVIVHDASGIKRSETVTVNVANETASRGGLVVGIDGGHSGWSWEEGRLRAALGASVTRHEFEMDEMYYADEFMLRATREVGTRIHALLEGNELGDPAVYRDFVVGFIRRYGEGGSFWAEHPELDQARYAIRTFELGNEPYFGTMEADRYADTVRPTLEAVKRLGLPAKIILPTLVWGGRTDWLDALYARIPNLNDLFHAFAEHPYTYGRPPEELGSSQGSFGRISSLRAQMNAKGAGGKPIYITEYGQSTAGCGEECMSEEAQAESLRRLIDTVASRGDWNVELLIVYQLQDRGTASGERELEFGLLREDGSPKPAYHLARERMQRHR